MENGNIESTKDLTIYLIKQNKWAIISAMVFGVFFIFFLPPLGIFLIIAPILYYSMEAHRQFMRHFAETNGMIYAETGALGDFKGKLFEIGTTKNVGNIISGSWNSFPIRIFNFSFAVGSGKSKITRFFTVLEITFEKIEFPFILLKSKSLWQNIFSADSVEISIQNGSFNLLATKGYEIETLQIFSNELLDYLAKNAPNFNIEFSNNRINIYDDKTINNKKDLTILLDVGKHIIDSSGAFISRLNDDFAALHPYYLDKTI